MMKTYTLPQTDLRFSRLAYGCMMIGGDWGTKTLSAAEQQAASRALDAAFDAGFTFFDHADIYTRGKSEAAFGAWLKAHPGRREQVVVQTKCGIIFPNDPEPGLPGRYDFSYGHIVRTVEGSLRRLGTDRVDLLLLHRPDPLVEPDEVARAFDHLHGAGKVRYFGVSNHTPGQVELLKQSVRQPLVVNQVELSLLHAHLIEAGIDANQHTSAAALAAGTLDYCRLHGILVQAWAPTAGGRLFHPEAGDGAQQRAAQAVAELAAARGVPPEAVALAWLLRHPAGIQPIIGTTRPERIRASAQADAVDLSREEWYTLLAAARGGQVP